MQLRNVLTLIAVLSATLLSTPALHAQATVTSAANQTQTVLVPSAQATTPQQTSPAPAPQTPTATKVDCGASLAKLVQFKTPPKLTPKFLRMMGGLYNKTGMVLNPAIFNLQSVVKPKPCPAAAPAPKAVPSSAQTTPPIASTTASPAPVITVTVSSAPGSSVTAAPVPTTPPSTGATTQTQGAVTPIPSTTATPSPDAGSAAPPKQ